ncbi:alpha/beta hydrolase fold domain-containing protein [Streptomyces sp. NPDC001941]|uniref:alpha/beta hydrolase fold domain-containing protein n=1 Tax=Streptomyces sp. NPDC001941 TaxID=3154659 RepID=UPI0033179A70
MTGMPAVPEGPDRLDPAARAFADLLAGVFPDVGGSVTDAAEARRVLDAAPRDPSPPLPVGGVEDRTVPGPEGAPELPVRIYRPEGPGPYPVVVFLHGGGWVLCGLDSHDGTCRALCREARAVVVSVDYRLAPEVRFPAPVEDAYAALSWADAHLADLEGASLVVAGDSAGGNLAAAAALLARERGGPAIALQALVYPALDAARDTTSFRENATGYFLTAAHVDWFWEQYLGPDGDGGHPLASPLRADPAGLPPAHVVTAGCDPLRDEGQVYAQRLRASGVEASESRHPGLFHGFLAVAPHLEEAGRALSSVAEAIAGTVPHRKNSGDHGGCAG